MKRKISASAAALFFALLSSTALADNAVIGMSFSGDPAQLQRDAKALSKFLIEHIKPGERASVVNLDDLSEIGVMEVPSNPAYAAPKAKLNVNKPFFAALFGAAKSAQPIEVSNDITGFLNFVARNHRSKEPGVILILSDPIQHAARDEANSMRGGKVPGDGHSLASRAVSPYGTHDAAGGLEHYRILIGGAGAQWRVTDQHAFFVEQFWAQNLSARGAVFLGVVDDFGALLKRAAKDEATPIDAPQLAPTDKLEMAVFRKAPPAKRSIYDREITAAAASAQSVRRAEHVEIGIRWDCVACDLDLYARPHPQADVIYFGAMETPAGRLRKDFRQSPTISNGLETIEFSAPIDLSKLDLAVNFYGGGPAHALTGELRIAIGADTWAYPFNFDVLAGNGGAGAQALFSSGGAPSAHWLRIDPMAVVGLEQGG